MNNPFNQLDFHDIEPALHKAARAIQSLRRLAASTMRDDASTYHLGLLFQAAHRLLAFDLTAPLTLGELKRLGHVLLAAAMLVGKIEESSRDKTKAVSSEKRGLWIDHANRAVWVDGRKVMVSGQNYELLIYLYTHTGRLCSRRELLEEVFHQRYDETDSSQISRLNTAMSRLRERIEEEPGQPRYVLTEPSGGYRFVQTE